MALSRLDHWHTRAFHDFLIERANNPFQWGVNDCALFAADAILAYTGVDIADEFRGKYNTEFGALKTIRQITLGSSVADAAVYCAEKHGLAEHAYPLMAKRGDLVLVENGGTLIAGIVHLNGRQVAVVTDTGLQRLPITHIKRSWSV